MTALCQCGCGLPAQVATRTDKRRGHVKGEPMALRLGHKRKSAVRWTVEDRGYDTPCWIWTLSVDRAGYGHFHDPNSNQTRRAHRVVYERMRGPIPEGLVVDHLCRIPGCVNPDHLEPVTQRENVRRGLRGELRHV